MVSQQHVDFEIEAFSDLGAARVRWERMQTYGASTPFQSFAWVSALIETVGRTQGAEPFILFVKDGRSGDDLMLLPLVRRRWQMLRFLELPDFGVGDYNTPVVSPVLVSEPKRLAEAWGAAMRALPEADVLHIQKIPELVGGTPNPVPRLTGMRQECYSSWQLALPENLNELEQRTLSSSTRRQIRRRTRQLESAGDLRFIVPASLSEAKALFAVLAEQRQARFEALGRHNIVASAPYRAFYERVLEGSADNDVAVMRALKVGNEIVATAFGLHWKKRFYLILSTLAGGHWMELSPGLIMIWKLIAAMHEKGCRDFDFTIGDEAYKRQLGATQGHIYQHFRPLSPAGMPFTWTLRLRPKLVAAKRLALSTIGATSPSKHRPALEAGT